MLVSRVFFFGDKGASAQGLRTFSGSRAKQQFNMGDVAFRFRPCCNAVSARLPRNIAETENSEPRECGWAGDACDILLYGVEKNEEA